MIRRGNTQREQRCHVTRKSHSVRLVRSKHILHSLDQKEKWTLVGRFAYNHWSRKSLEHDRSSSHAWFSCHRGCRFLLRIAFTIYKLFRIPQNYTNNYYWQSFRIFYVLRWKLKRWLANVAMCCRNLKLPKLVVNALK